MPLLHNPRLPRFLACLEGTREDPVLWLIELARALPGQELSGAVGSALEPDGQYFRSMKNSPPDCHSSCRIDRGLLRARSRFPEILGIIRKRKAKEGNLGTRARACKASALPAELHTFNSMIVIVRLSQKLPAAFCEVLVLRAKADK